VDSPAPTLRREALESFQREHRLGRLTVVFTDIVGSTDLKQMLGDVAAQALIGAHHNLVRAILSEFRGAQEIETAGDSFLLVFAQPADAVTFALRLQAGLRAQPRGAASVRDRIGIHVGEVLIEPGSSPAEARSLSGIQVDTCARLMSTGGPDQILMSRPAHDQAKMSQEGWSVPGLGAVAWRAYGPYHFKGLEEPLELFEVGEEGKARLRAPDDSDKAMRCRPGRVPVWPGPGGRRVSHRLWERAAYATAATLLIVAAAGLFFPDHVSTLLDAAAFRQPQCIVVLPFRGLENDPAHQSLADGVSRTVVSRLTQLAGTRWSLRVVPISDVFAEKVDSVAEARRVFGATLVLSGDATAVGDTMRLNVILSEARARRQLKSTTLDLGPESLFAAQDRVARLAADWLGLTIAAASAQPVNPVPNRTAFAAYLRGIGALARQDRKDHREMAVAAFEESLRQEPGYAPSHAGLGEALLRVYERDRRDAPGLLAKARLSSEKAVSLDDKLPAARIALAAVDLRQGRHEEAIRGYESALQLEPGNAEALRGLAGAFRAAGNVAGAETIYKRAVERSPDYWGGYNDLGVFYSAIGRYREAEESFRKVAALVPDSYSAHRSLAGVLYQQGHVDEAIAMSMASLQLRPSAEAYSNLGTIEFSRGRYLESAAYFEKAVELNPSRHVLWGNLGDACIMAPELRPRASRAYRQALSQAERELLLNPRDADLHASAATYLQGLGERARAVAEVEQARALAPAALDYLFLAGLVYEAAGRRGDALGALEEAARKGYAPLEIKRHPQLAALRQDPRYESIQSLLDRSR
jgi:tetratricopeptide (TPR) repeat protein/class 3 adenylate cyclase